VPQRVSKRAMSATPDVAPPDVEHVNVIRLVGRLSAAPELRVLPSGDEICVFRLVVERAGPRDGVTIDTIDCVAHRAPIRRASQRWSPGEVLEVEGALRRRFWRTGVGVASRYEVEVSHAGRSPRA